MDIGILAQNQSNGAGVVGLLIYLVICVLVIAGFWKTFEKAGQPGWAAIVPIYNVYVMCKVAGRPGWWIILYLIPLVNLVIAAIVSIDIAKSFGKGTGFGIGLWLLSPIFFCVLGFESA